MRSPLDPKPVFRGFLMGLWSRGENATLLSRYLNALVVVGLAVLFRIVALEGLGNRLAYLTLYPAVMVAAVLGGFGPGLLATLASGFAVAVLWIEPGEGWNSAPTLLGMAIFLTSSVIVSALAGSSRRAHVALRQGARELADANAHLRREVELREGADARLRQNEQRFRLAALGDAITLYEQDLELRYRWLYPERPEHVGALGRTDAELMPGPEGEELMRRKQEVARTGVAQRVEVRAKLADGRVHYYDTSICPRRAESGEIAGVAGTALDITERKLAEENRQRLASIVEYSDDAIITMDLNGVITSWNLGAARIFGYPPASVLGRPISMLIPPERRDEEQQMLGRVRAGEQIDHYETQRIRGDGVPIDISLTVSPLRSGAGEIIGASKIAREITERVRRQRLADFLANLNEQLEAKETPTDVMREASAATGRFFGVQRCGFAEWNRDGTSVTIACDWTVREWPSAQGTHALARFGPRPWASRIIGGAWGVSDVNADPDLGGYAAVYAGWGVRAFAVATVRRKEGNVVTLYAATDRARAWRNDELEFLKSVLDRVWPLVERARSEEALRVSERQLRLVTDTAPVFLAHFDRDHRYKFVNQTYARRFNREANALVGVHLSDVIGPTVYAAIRERLEEAFAGRRVEFEAELTYPAVGARWVHVVYTPETTAGGEVVGVMALILDITERKHTEREVELARDQALAASRAKDDFLAALSHELRTPLNPVLLIASEAAENPALPSDVRRDFVTIRKSVELEARLIDDLLDLTRITHGKLPLDRRVIDGAAVLQDALSVVRADAAEKRIALTVESDASRSLLLADGVRVQQVFWNILKNAVKFTPPGGRIRVRATTLAAENRFRVTVEDNGIGMTAAELGRVFDAFTQGDHAVPTGSHRFGGMGLGLTISRMLVVLHGGEIRANSRGPGEGTVVEVDLPLATSDAMAQGAARPPTLGAFATAAGVGRVTAPPRRILVVEDHAATREALASLLRRRNYEVLTAGSLAEARERASAGGISLLVSDIGLPDGDGCDLMTELRQSAGLKGIALTGYEADIARTARAGFVAHLTKPVRVQALDAALASAWQAQTEARAGT